MKKEGKKIPHKLVTDKRKKIKKGNWTTDEIQDKA